VVAGRAARAGEAGSGLGHPGGGAWLGGVMVHTAEPAAPGAALLHGPAFPMARLHGLHRTTEAFEHGHWLPWALSAPTFADGRHLALPPAHPAPPAHATPWAPRPSLPPPASEYEAAFNSTLVVSGW
jgi:hypothetical protein